MIWNAIAAAAVLVGVHWTAWYQGFLRGGEDAHREGYNKGFKDATDLAKLGMFDWQKPAARRMEE